MRMHGQGTGPGQEPPTERWECRCGEPPILLAMYRPGGQIEIKLRDRYYWASGCVHATCPRCGARHVLDLRPAESGTDSTDPPVIQAGQAGQAGDSSTGWPPGTPPERH